jgi:hypothetical protein
VKKLLIPLAGAFIAAIMALGMVLPVSASAPTSLTLDLIIDGRGTAQDVGDVVINYDGAGHFNVAYNIDSTTGWTVVETHVYLDLIPPTKSAPGKFPYTAADTIDLTPAPGAIVYIAAHAELQKEVVLETGEIIIVTESGWAQSATATDNYSIPPGKNWATFVEWIPVPAE